MKPTAIAVIAFVTSLGIGISTAAVGQTTNEKAEAHTKEMIKGKSHDEAVRATPPRSDPAETARWRAEHEALMKRGLSHSTATQEGTRKSDAAAVNENARRHAESMKKGRDHSAAALESNEPEKVKR